MCVFACVHVCAFVCVCVCVSGVWVGVCAPEPIHRESPHLDVNLLFRTTFPHRKGDVHDAEPWKARNLDGSARQRMLGFNLVFRATLLAPLCQLRRNQIHIRQPALGRVILYGCEVAQDGVVQNVRIGAQPVREVLDQGSSVSMLFRTRKRRVRTEPRSATKHG